MNKIFHEKITFGKVFFLLLIMAVFFFFAWNKMAWKALLFLIIAVFTLEMLLHSTYTITSAGQLILYKGRFVKSKVISLQDIDRIESGHYSFNLFFHFGSYLLIVMKDGKEIGIRPDKEKEFIDYIEYKLTHLAQQDFDND